MKNIFTFTLLLATIFILSIANSFGQSTCDCSTYGVCSTSQTCPAGFIAVCTCTAASCGSSCEKVPGDEDNRQAFSGELDLKDLRAASAPEIGAVLSKTFNRRIEFIPNVKGFKFTQPAQKLDKNSYWDTLDYLSKHGKLKIDGLGMTYWNATRSSLLKGDDFKICTGGAPVSMILRRLSFLSGTKLTVISGDPNTIISKPLKGNGLSDLVAQLSEISGVSVVQN